MFENVMKDIQKLNAKANWSNLMAGAGLLLVLVLGSLWYFGRKAVNTNNIENKPFTLEDLKETEANTPAVAPEGEGAKAAEELGKGGPVVEKLPNTSSK